MIALKGLTLSKGYLSVLRAIYYLVSVFLPVRDFIMLSMDICLLDIYVYLINDHMSPY